jgi:hypothetical protein
LRIVSRSASVDATSSVQASGVRIQDRANEIVVIPDIEVDGEHVVIRITSVDADADISVIATDIDYGRRASFDAIGDITAVGGTPPPRLKSAIGDDEESHGSSGSDNSPRGGAVGNDSGPSNGLANSSTRSGGAGAWDERAFTAVGE